MVVFDVLTFASTKHFVKLFVSCEWSPLFFAIVKVYPLFAYNVWFTAPVHSLHEILNGKFNEVEEKQVQMEIAL